MSFKCTAKWFRYIYTHTYIPTYAYACVYMYMCVCVCVCVYIYIFSPGVTKISWRRMATHSSIVPGDPHGQRNLAGYSPWSRKEWDTTEQLIWSDLIYQLAWIICSGPDHSSIYWNCKTVDRGPDRENFIKSHNMCDPAWNIQWFSYHKNHKFLEVN